LVTLKISDVGRSWKGELDRIVVLAGESSFSLRAMSTWLEIQRRLIERWGVVLRIRMMGRAEEGPVLSGRELMN